MESLSFEVPRKSNLIFSWRRLALEERLKAYRPQWVTQPADPLPEPKQPRVGEHPAWACQFLEYAPLPFSTGLVTLQGVEAPESYPWVYKVPKGGAPGKFRMVIDYRAINLWDGADE